MQQRLGRGDIAHEWRPRGPKQRDRAGYVRRSHGSTLHVYIGRISGEIAGAHGYARSRKVGLEKVRRVISAGPAATEVGQLIVDVVGADGEGRAVDRRYIVHGRTIRARVPG